MRSIVRRDTGETLPGVSDAARRRRPGIKTPTREALARLDRRRKKRTSNTDWQNPVRSGREDHEDEGRPHASRAQSRARHRSRQRRAGRGDPARARTSATRRVSVETVDRRDRTGRGRARREPTPAALTELVADKGYHSNQTMIDLRRHRGAVLHRGAGSRPPPLDDRRRTRNAPVYGNRRRVRGARGQRLLRRRGEYVERSFAHVYDTGGMRRTHLRGHRNILKRLLVHASAFNLGLLMRQAVRPRHAARRSRISRGPPIGIGPEDLSNPVYYAIVPELARVWAKTRSEFPQIVTRTATQS